MTASTRTPRQQFDALVPFFLTDQLSATDREWVQQYLATHPEAWAELDWHRDLMTQVVAKAEARAHQAPEMVGWAQVQAQLQAARRPVQQSFGERLRAWLGGFTPQRWAPVAAVVILAQGAVIGSLLQRAPLDDGEPTRSVSAVAARDVLQVRFKQNTTERDLRALLYGAGARVVDGPDQLGDYIIEPRRGALDDLRAELERSELVQRVTPLKAWKPEPRDE